MQRWSWTSHGMDYDKEGRFVLLADARKSIFTEYLGARGIKNTCSSCGGLGSKIYPSTTTYHGGVGGNITTLDICNRCWGSGDVLRPGINLILLNSFLSAAAKARNQLLKLYEAQPGIEWKDVDVIDDIERLITRFSIREMP
jgi:hypothetical protein